MNLKPNPQSAAKKAVLKNFAKFTEKQLCWSLFLNKIAGLRLQHRRFPVNFVKFLRTPLFTEHLRGTASKSWIMQKGVV